MSGVHPSAAVSAEVASSNVFTSATSPRYAADASGVDGVGRHAGKQERRREGGWRTTSVCGSWLLTMPQLAREKMSKK